MIRSAWVGLVVLTACGSSSNDVQRAAELVHKADRKLAAGRLHEARQAYEEALALVPTHAKAAAGSAVTDVLLLPDSPAVAGLLDRCREPRFDVEHSVFGAEGLLAQLAARRQGTADLHFYYRPRSGETFIELPFAPGGVHATRADLLTLSVSSTDESATGGVLSVPLNPVDLYRDDGLQPLVDGARIDFSRTAQSPFADVADVTTGGVLGGGFTFHGSAAVGGQARFVFEDLRFAVCANGACDGELLVRGSVEDVVDDPQLLLAAFPFQTPSEVGPPVVPGWVVTLERCMPALSADDLATAGVQLAERLERIRSRLGVALAGGPESVSFTLPGSLAHATNDLQLNGVDLLTLRALTGLAQAGLHLAAAYRTLDGPLASFLEVAPHCASVAPACPASLCGEARPPEVTLRQQHGFSLQRLADGLGQRLFELASHELIRRAGTELDGALGDLNAAWSTKASTPGVFDWRSSKASPLTDDLQALGLVLRSSLSSAAPVPLPGPGGHAVHLASFFESPPDRQRLLERAGVTSLVQVRGTDPSAPHCDAYEARLEPTVAASWSTAVTLLSPALQSPHCSDDACHPTPVRGSAWQQAMGGHWPAFVSTSLRRFFIAWL